MPRSYRDEAETQDKVYAFENFVTSLADNLDPNAGKGSKIWIPIPGPQTQAYESPANETFMVEVLVVVRHWS